MSLPLKSKLWWAGFLFAGHGAFAQTGTLTTSAVAASPSPTPQVQTPTNVADKVPVELEWEEIGGAKIYELEFQNFEGKVLTTFRSPNHLFKFKMKVGKYKVRSRVGDDRKVFGPWSSLTEFSVEPKAPFVGETAVRTTGKIDPKTLMGEVVYHWGTALGSRLYKLTIYDADGNVVHEEITSNFHFKMKLPAGEYIATLTALGSDGLASAPVPLPGKAIINSARLAAPEILLDKEKRLPTKEEMPVVRWKSRNRTLVSGVLEYRFFFGDEWIPVQNFKAASSPEAVLEKAKKPGRYRISLWAESPGLLKSQPAIYEFVVKPKAYEAN